VSNTLLDAIIAELGAILILLIGAIGARLLHHAATGKQKDETGGAPGGTATGDAPGFHAEGH
jgi:hypothetical protein